MPVALEAMMAEFSPEDRAEIERVVATVLDAIGDALSGERRVELRGFGAFSTRGREARTGRNPRTGEAVAVAPKRVPHFKPGKEMREKLNLDGLG